MKRSAAITEIMGLFGRRGHSQYGGEAVTQLEHALQAADLAEKEQASAALITAALLHDVGHLLHELPVDAPDRGLDDHHENSARNYLRAKFPDSVVAPVRMHVAAKRYLCAKDTGYFELLSEPSVVSLRLQGGPMSATQVQDFEAQPFWQDAIRLRRWDDTAKVVGLETAPLEHFVKYLEQVVLDAREASA